MHFRSIGNPYDNSSPTCRFHQINLVFPFLVLLNLSNYFNYGPFILTNTGMNYVLLSVWKYIYTYALNSSVPVLITTCITHMYKYW